MDAQNIMQNEFKFHVNRSYGTEQFTFSATVHSHKIALSEDEINQSLEAMSAVIHKQFTEVVSREIKEKKAAAERLNERVQANKEMGEAIAKVNLAGVLQKYSVDEVNGALAKLAEQATEETETEEEVADVKPSPYNG